MPITINRLGYREREFVIDHPPGICRILALGDSFTFGIGVGGEETYSKVLA